jgi:RNA polymerase sigma-70 factor (ECF subfamily)
MFRKARRVVPSDDLAWDVVQDVLMRAWRFEWLPEQPRGVLFGLVHPTSLSALRTARRRREHEHCACRQCRESSDADDPARSLESEDALRRIGREIAALPVECRDVLRLCAEGHDQTDIALQLGVPVGTVYSRLHRARALLKPRLGGLLEEAS